MKMFAFQLQNSLWHKPQTLINQRIATEMIFQPNAGLLGANSDGAQQLLQHPDGQGPNGVGQQSAHNDVSRYRPLGFEELESDNEEDEDDDDDDDDEDDSDDGSREEEDQQAMDSLGDDEEADDIDGQQML